MGSIAPLISSLFMAAPRYTRILVTVAAKAHRLVFVAASLGALSACGAEQVAPDNPTQFRLQPVVTIGAAPDTGQLPSIPNITPLLGGQYHVVSTPWGRGKWLPRVYDVRGGFVAEIGREGSGPGEFRGAEMVFATGDTAMIHDASLQRMHFVLPPDSLLRSIPWPSRPFTMLELRDGSFVLTTGDFAPGPPMQHVSRDGQVLEDFGEPQTSQQQSQHRLFAAAPDGSFWSARSQQRLELQHWRAPGELLATVPLSSDWFTPYDVALPASRTTPPSPVLTAMWTDDAGLVWLVGLVAGERWFEGLSASRTLGDGREFSLVEDADRVFDTIVEVWDPVTPRRLWTERLNRVYATQLGPWLMANTRELDDGHVVAEVVRVVPR
jgi:hypothetical protein